MSTEVALLEIKNPLEAFSTQGGLDSLIERIEREVLSIDRDISTEAGRKNIASLAHKIAKTKTALDKMGKDLTESQRAPINSVNAERKRAWDRLEEIQREVRKPLTEWKNIEKERVAAHEQALEAIERDHGLMHMTSSNIATKMIEVNDHHAARDWQEFKHRAQAAIEDFRNRAQNAYHAVKKAEDEAEELKRLREAEQTRLQAEREARIAEEAAQKARDAAQLAARKEAEEAEARARKAQEEIEAAKKAEQERAERAEREKAEALERERRAIEDKKEAEKKAKDEAERAAKEAVERERQQQKAKAEAEARAAAAREADKAHQAKVNNEALYGILSVIYSQPPEDCSEFERNTGKNLVKAIASGQIAHVKITY